MKLGETHNYITIMISFLAPQRSLCTFGLHIFGPSSCVSLRLRFVCVYAWQRDWRPDERERNRAQRYILWWKRHGQRSFPRPHRTKQNLKKKKTARERPNRKRRYMRSACTFAREWAKSRVVLTHYFQFNEGQNLYRFELVWEQK